MKVKATFTDGREPMYFGGIKAAHQHGDTGNALLKTQAREFELENVKCLHVYAKSGPIPEDA